jgi:hypothetical protein
MMKREFMFLRHADGVGLLHKQHNECKGERANISEGVRHTYMK